MHEREIVMNFIQNLVFQLLMKKNTGWQEASYGSLHVGNNI